MDTAEYVPRRKSSKDDNVDNAVEGLLNMEVDDDKSISEVERTNQELLDKYPDEYRKFRNNILLEIQPKIEAEFEREKDFHSSRIEKSLGDMLLKEEEKLLRAMEQNMEDEIKKTMIKEMKYAERRKEVECKRAYARIKNEVIKAKNEGVKMCLHCGEINACHSCKCNQAFYCNRTCLKKHFWIHQKLCAAN